MRECVAVAALVCIALGCEKGAVTPHGKPDGGDSRTRGDGIGGDVVADLEGDGRAPDQAVLPDRSADVALPDGMAPDGPVPDGPGADLLTDGPVPDDLASDGAPFDGALPDGALPDGALPDGALPDGALPDGALPDGALPDGAVADGAGSEVTEGCSKVDCGLSCDDPQVCGDCGNGVCDAGEVGAACPFDCCDPSLCLGTPGPEWVDGTPGCAGQVDGTPCSDGKEGNGLETCLSKKCRFENPHCHCAVPEGASPIPDPGPGPEEPAIPMPAEVPAWQGDMPEEPDFEDAWGLFSLDVSAAWQVTEGAPTVLVAIVDSGCADDNPDLDGKIVEQVDLFDSDDVAQDDLGHGTVLASIVAANKDGGGIVGVAPDVSLLCARVSGTDGVASYEALAAGIQWAVDHSASVILVGHAGFGSGEGLAVLEEAIHKAAEADVVLIAPAGSGGGSNLDLFPGAWSPDAIAVAASTDAGG
ncbi:MAG: hypothetical protein FJ109_13810, partial [Deltaproteobacteria bacterium]|nr:hypothetical protein [Deltaproteobacteria bacterium]